MRLWKSTVTLIAATVFGVLLSSGPAGADTLARCSKKGADDAAAARTAHDKKCHTQLLRNDKGLSSSARKTDYQRCKAASKDVYVRDIAVARAVCEQQMPANSAHQTVTLEGDIHWVIGFTTHLRLDATSCSGANGPWKGNLRATHPPVGKTDPAFDRTFPVGWTFKSDGMASFTTPESQDSLYGVTHTQIFTAYLTVAAGSIKVVDIIGIEDKGAPTSVGPLYSNVGVAVPMQPTNGAGCP